MMELLNVLQYAILLGLSISASSAVVAIPRSPTSSIPSPASVVQSVPHPNSTSTNTFQNNLTSIRGTRSATPDELPPNPFVINIPGTDVSVTFSNYGRKVFIDDARQCIAQAIAETVRQIEAEHGEDPIRNVLRYEWGAILVLYPTPMLSWMTWVTAINGIIAFVEAYEAVELIFNINKSPAEGLGTGYLALTSLNHFTGDLPLAASSGLTSRTHGVNSTNMNETIPSIPSIPSSPSK
ncbi:hypothetical protein N7G274_006227 [Stereocaulon virgatum]|uniref:Uncharacterized protein n=1 Tax=Stereocaulon virgatum TaxID=373712 RepID=A0ABR4A4D3_9LECA